MAIASGYWKYRLERRWLLKEGGFFDIVGRGKWSVIG
jgi:hypothetical protein